MTLEEAIKTAIEFEIKVRDARVGRNPRTGEAVPILEKRVAVFKPGKALKYLVEQSIGKPKAPGPDDHPPSP